MAAGLRAEAERVTFGSEEVELAGEFREAQAGRPQPGLVFTGPFTGVKEQVAGTYAGLVATAGFATLAFDHRGFGESGGRPGHEDSQGKLADLRAAVGFLARRAEADAARIGIVGICPGGGYAVRAAAADPRVKAVAPHWRNRATRGSLHSLMTFDALSAAELLADTPLLIVHGTTDAYCSPELAQALYERKPGEKEILWLEAGQHTDFYDSEPYVTRAAQAAAGFLRRKLRPPASSSPRRR